VLTAFFFVDAWLLGIVLQRMAYGCLTVGIRCKAALTTAIARKCYNMAHLTKDTAAEAVGFVASDIGKIFEGIQEVHYLWWARLLGAWGPPAGWTRRLHGACLEPGRLRATLPLCPPLASAPSRSLPPLTARPAAPLRPRRGAPVEAIAILALLGSLVGIYSLPGIFVVCLVVPAQYYFGERALLLPPAVCANCLAQRRGPNPSTPPSSAPPA
jgi:hypothetical protein